MEQQTPMAMVPRARAIRTIREWIEGGTWGQGETLPSERALAVRLGVGRATVRRALQVLQAEGLILDRGGHVRTVAPAKQPGDGLMRQTVVLVGLPGGRERSGWGQEIAPGALDEAQGVGAHVLWLAPGRLEAGEIEQLAIERPMGVVLLGFGELAEAIARSGIPVVAYGDGEELAGFDRVVSDHATGAYELTQWLIGQGKRRILTLWNDSIQVHWVQERLRGYGQAMREAGLEPIDPVEMPRVQVNGEQQLEAATRLAAGYLAQHLNGANPVDAVMGGSDEEAVAIAAACRILGKEAGRDLLVAGYDNHWPDLAGKSDARLQATVDQQNLQIGRELVKLLMERVGGKLPKEPQRRVVRPRMVVLENTVVEGKPPVLVSVVQQEREGKSEPLFGWKMEGGRWMLGRKSRGQR